MPVPIGSYVNALIDSSLQGEGVAQILPASAIRRGDVICFGVEEALVVSAVRNRGCVQIIGALSDHPDDSVGLIWPADAEFSVIRGCGS